MNSVKKINKLADLFEFKLYKIAQEDVPADSKIVTSMIRPIFNNIIEEHAENLLKNGPLKIMLKKATDAANKGGGMSGQVIIGGNVKGIITKVVSSKSKIKSTDKFKINPASFEIAGTITGDFAKDKDVLISLNKIKEQLKKVAIPLIENNFNKFAFTSFPDATDIGEFDVFVNSKDAEI